MGAAAITSAELMRVFPGERANDVVDQRTVNLDPAVLLDQDVRPDLSLRPPHHTLGGHVSLGSRPERTFADLRHQGYRNMQIHASSPRTWRTPDRDPGEYEQLRALRLEHGIDPLFLHAVYLINLASDDDRIYEASLRSLSWSLTAAARLGAAGVVVHPGSHTGRGFETVRARVAGALQHVLENSPRGPKLLLENSAGGGGSIGSSFGELNAIVSDLGAPIEVGICLDTAHAFAAGFDLRSDGGVRRLLDDIDAGPGLDRVAVLHLNDSKSALGSHADRHENIGAGLIGREGFAMILSRAELAGIPLVLETPNPERRRDDMAAVRAMCSAKVLPPVEDGGDGKGEP